MLTGRGGKKRRMSARGGRQMASARPPRPFGPACAPSDLVVSTRSGDSAAAAHIPALLRPPDSHIGAETRAPRSQTCRTDGGSVIALNPPLLRLAVSIFCRIRFPIRGALLSLNS
ncbi:hypothetical protein PGT21_015138 [Puccinia graminis f. sp. tritici]|uniref:Uncharacterized protein n=1 Tax=Puccinia graminis f. sp. tritici TaxID=56615 RepID=A0A5B0PUG0_PUCGR|nr:hypothetical protein PGT21_015138 [Puccinia graminis f. sp. tritici]